MRISNHYKSISRLLILLSFTSFFIGFFYGENSAGGGTLQGDFDNVWKDWGDMWEDYNVYVQDHMNERLDAWASSGVADDDDSCPNEDSSGYDADADGCIDDSDSDGVKDDADICPFDANDGCPAALANEQTEGECVGGDVKNEDCNTCTCEVDLDGNETWVCSEMDCAEMKEDTPGFGIFAAIVSCIIIVFRRKLD